MVIFHRKVEKRSLATRLPRVSSPAPAGRIPQPKRGEKLMGRSRRSCGKTMENGPVEKLWITRDFHS